jgi:hypothetical protein
MTTQPGTRHPPGLITLRGIDLLVSSYLKSPEATGMFGPGSDTQPTANSVRFGKHRSQRFFELI